MSRPPENTIKLSETLTLSEYRNRGDYTGFWLYDDTLRMNLVMRGRTERDAFVEALHYYQKRLTETEKKYYDLQTKVNAFVEQFKEED